MSQSNTSRGNSSRGGRGRRGRGGGNAPPQQPPFAGGLVGGNYIPPPLPVGLQRLIDGRTLAAVRVEYTPSGAVVMAVPVEGEPQPLHEWRLARERANKKKECAERRALYQSRVETRGIKVVVPATFSSLAAAEEWLAGLDKADRKLVLMTNKEFRALQSTSASAEEQKIVASGSS